MRVCLVYDCLFPYTVGGAERWYRNLGERLASDEHDVTYLTLRQWDRGSQPDLGGVRVKSVGPRMGLYTERGRRRILPPIVFGVGVFWHLLRYGRRYDAVHTASFPYFSLIAAGMARPLHHFRLVVDWHEVWSRPYWREYLGRWAGGIGWLIQRACARIPQHAFCFSRLHADRLRREGLRSQPTILRGEYDGPLVTEDPIAPDPIVVFAGRHIPEKQVLLIPAAIDRARRRVPGLQGLILGDGPERRELIRLVERLDLGGVIEVPGFVEPERVDDALARALCLLLPSRREGYGMVVIEAARHGTPSILVAGDDNAATELVQNGLNGIIVEKSEADAIANAIAEVHEAGVEMRKRTAAWFAQSRDWITLDSSLATVLEGYQVPLRSAEPRRLIPLRGRPPRGHGNP